MSKSEDEAPAPIPMILTCPMCGKRHIDIGEFAVRSHHTHACQHCGLPWRPAIVPTVGVQFLPGFKNEPSAEERVASRAVDGAAKRAVLRLASFSVEVKLSCEQELLLAKLLGRAPYPWSSYPRTPSGVLLGEICMEATALASAYAAIEKYANECRYFGSLGSLEHEGRVYPINCYAWKPGFSICVTHPDADAGKRCCNSNADCNDNRSSST